MTPLMRLAAIIAEEGLEPGEDSDNHAPALCELQDGAFFVLVEYNVRSPQHWITLHADPNDAVSMHFAQEYAEEWMIETLMDLRDGQLYDIEYRAVAIPAAAIPQEGIPR